MFVNVGAKLYILRLYLLPQDNTCSRYLHDLHQHPGGVVLRWLQLDLDAAFWRHQAGHLLLHAPLILDHLLWGAPHGTVHAPFNFVRWTGVRERRYRLETLILAAE